MCKSCKSGTYHQSENIGMTGFCKSTCPESPNPYMDSIRQRCFSKCESPLWGVDYPTLKKCESSCPEGTFKKEDTRKCTQCNFNCVTCSGAGESMCLTCKINLFHQIQIVGSNGECLNSCRVSTYKYADKITQRCYETCPITRFSVEATLTCEDYCPSGTYSDTVQRSCLKCSQVCRTCLGPAISDCLTCESSLYHQIPLEGVKGNCLG
jgi:proprotein convertase subtilisin/kexin type 5